MCLFCSIIKGLSSHEADPVSGLIGLNSSTGGTTKDGNKWGIVKEAKNALGGETTSHNCYGVGTLDCSKQELLNGEQPLNWEPVYKPNQINMVVPNNKKTTERE